MRRWTNLFVVILLLFAFHTVSVAQKIETKDGVRIVHNSKEGIWEKSPKLKLKKFCRKCRKQTEHKEVKS